MGLAAIAGGRHALGNNSLGQAKNFSGAIRIPFLSFQFLIRPGCTAKLLCFHTAGGFESHRSLYFKQVFGAFLLGVPSLSQAIPLGTLDAKMQVLGRSSSGFGQIPSLELLARCIGRLTTVFTVARGAC